MWQTKFNLSSKRIPNKSVSYIFNACTITINTKMYYIMGILTAKFETLEDVVSLDYF